MTIAANALAAGLRPATQGPERDEQAKELTINLIGEDPKDIAQLWDKLCWAGASVGRSGLATQAVAA